MKTGNNKATNNFIVRIWSREYYGEKTSPKHKYNIFDGTITCTKTKKTVHFRDPAKFLTVITKLNNDEEKRRRDEDKKQ